MYANKIFFMNRSRFLRNLDRTRNNDAYPALHYPEMYLLDGGYKSFYEQYSELCEPNSYKPMLDPAHESDLRHFRAKSKTWNSDTRGRPQLRPSFKRLGFPQIQYTSHVNIAKLQTLIWNKNRGHLYLDVGVKYMTFFPHSLFFLK